MPYILEELVINRVDLVDEGANSAAFIELCKRKEQCDMNFEEILAKMKPEHAETIRAELAKAKEPTDAAAQLESLRGELAKAKEDLAEASKELDTLKAKECTCDGEADGKGMCKACGKPKKAKAKAGTSFDEAETLKSMPEAARELFAKMRSQKEAAEEELRKSRDAEATAQAVAKAKELKAIPVEQEKLVGIIKSANPEMLDLLTVVNAAIEGTVLDEVGKSHTSGTTGAWDKIEAKAEEVAKSRNISKAKAISEVIQDNPELYKEYLEGGAN